MKQNSLSMDFITKSDWPLYFSIATGVCCIVMLVSLIIITVAVARMRRRLETFLRQHRDLEHQMEPSPHSEPPTTLLSGNGSGNEVEPATVEINSEKRTQNRGAYSQLEPEQMNMSTFRAGPKFGQKKSPRLQPAGPPKTQNAHAPVPPVAPNAPRDHSPKPRAAADQSAQEDAVYLDLLNDVANGDDAKNAHIEGPESTSTQKAEKVQNDDDHMYDECTLASGEKETVETVYDEAVNPESLPLKKIGKEPITTNDPKAAMEEEEDEYVEITGGVGGENTGMTDEYVECVHHDVTTDVYETPQATQKQQTICQSNQRKPEALRPKQKWSPGPTPTLPAQPGKKPNRRENATKAPDCSKDVVLENKSALSEPQAPPPPANDREGTKRSAPEVIYANDDSVQLEGISSGQIYQNHSVMDGDNNTSLYENFDGEAGSSKGQPAEDLYVNVNVERTYASVPLIWTNKATR